MSSLQLFMTILLNPGLREAQVCFPATARLLVLFLTSYFYSLLDLILREKSPKGHDCGQDTLEDWKPGGPHSGNLRQGFQAMCLLGAHLFRASCTLSAHFKFSHLVNSRSPPFTASTFNKYICPRKQIIKNNHKPPKEFCNLLTTQYSVCFRSNLSAWVAQMFSSRRCLRMQLMIRPDVRALGTKLGAGVCGNSKLFSASHASGKAFCHPQP